jgi:hypothetical protein
LQANKNKNAVKEAQMDHEIGKQEEGRNQAGINLHEGKKKGFKLLICNAELANCVLEKIEVPVYSNEGILPVVSFATTDI